MPIVANDLKAFLAANMPENDTATVGGAIDNAGKVEFTDLAANDTLRMRSDGADTRVITVTGRDATGAIVSENFTLNGTTNVNGATTFERILKVIADSTSATRIVTIERIGGTAVGTLDLNIGKIRRLFYDSSSEASSTTRYEKIFMKNTHATLTLNSAAVKLTADPSASIRIGCAPSVNDSATAANRKTAPASVTFVDDSVSQGVPGGTLAAGAAIGVWAEFVRGSSAAAVKSTFTVELAGTTV